MDNQSNRAKQVIKDATSIETVLSKKSSGFKTFSLRGFFLGILVAVLFLCTAQDYLGLEGWVQFERNHWHQYSWASSAAIVFFLILGLCLMVAEERGFYDKLCHLPLPRITIHVTLKRGLVSKVAVSHPSVVDIDLTVESSE